VIESKKSKKNKTLFKNPPGSTDQGGQEEKWKTKTCKRQE